MKLVLRVFAMMVVCTGLLTVALAPSSIRRFSNASFVAVGPGPLTLPAPGCGPHIPTCPHIAQGQ
jgi:hypothetical protein